MVQVKRISNINKIGEVFITKVFQLKFSCIKIFQNGWCDIFWTSAPVCTGTATATSTTTACLFYTFLYVKASSTISFWLSFTFNSHASFQKCRPNCICSKLLTLNRRGRKQLVVFPVFGGIPLFYWWGSPGKLQRLDQPVVGYLGRKFVSMIRSKNSLIVHGPL